ncbi:WD domain-containing protein [Achlya hypogyna]|uniref:WD domain-containing protein n=1 Tax=Achlya hypogyna TaxID=1202772 RepID=A0A1V9YZT4_ACHHY|nr:WD domain-containing protein [Achlya hypogyna]
MDPSLQRTFRGHKSGVAALAYGPKQLVSGSMDCSVMVWHFKPQVRAFRFQGHKGPVFDVSVAPSGELIASGSQDRTVRLWTPTVKGESHILKGHVGGVRSVDFSYDSGELLTASDDKSIKMWSLPTRRFVCSWNGHANWVRSARFSPDARLLISGSDDKTVKLWDKSTRNCITTFYDHSGIINAVRFHPDGTTIGACSFDHSINLWDIRSQKLIQHYPAHEGNVTSLDFHPNGHYCLSTSVDGTIKLWDIREGHLLYTLHGHTGAVNAATFSPDGTCTASGGVDALVMVWDTDLDKCLHAHEPQYPQPLPKTHVLRHVRPESPPPVVAAPPPAPMPVPLYNNTHDLYNPSAIRYDPMPVTGNGGSGHHVSPRHESPQPRSSRGHSSPRVHFAPTKAPTAYVSGDSDRGRRGPSPRSNNHSVVEEPVEPRRDPEVPEQLGATFDHIVGQLEIITRTLTILEERLCHAEDRIADVARVQTQMLRQQNERLSPGRRPTLVHPRAESSPMQSTATQP